MAPASRGNGHAPHQASLRPRLQRAAGCMETVSPWPSEGAVFFSAAVGRCATRARLQPGEGLIAGDVVDGIAREPLLLANPFAAASRSALAPLREGHLRATHLGGNNRNVVIRRYTSICFQLVTLTLTIITPLAAPAAAPASTHTSDPPFALCPLRAAEAIFPPTSRESTF